MPTLHAQETTAFGINWETAGPADVAGIDVDAQGEFGETPLHWAAASNENPAVIGRLLEAGAKIDAQDNDGWTPLHLAGSQE